MKDHKLEKKYSDKYNINNILLQNIKIICAVNNEFKKDIEDIEMFEDSQEPNLKFTFPGDISKFRVKYGLSSIYTTAIDLYLQGKKILSTTKDRGNDDLFPFITNHPFNENEKVVALKISPETTLDDIKEQWDYICHKRNWLQGLCKLKQDKTRKIYKRKNVERDLEILKLKNENNKAKEITEIINRKYTDAPICYQDVSKIVKRLRVFADEILGKKE